MKRSEKKKRKEQKIGKVKNQQQMFLWASGQAFFYFLIEISCKMLFRSITQEPLCRRLNLNDIFEFLRQLVFGC